MSVLMKNINTHCSWCGRKITSYPIRYAGRVFCNRSHYGKYKFYKTQYRIPVFMGSDLWNKEGDTPGYLLVLKTFFLFVILLSLAVMCVNPR